VPQLAEVIVALQEWFDPARAEDWDAIGLVCGDPAEPVNSVLLAVDPVPGVVDEVIDIGAQLLITHHPLLLRGVHGVPATDPKGSLVHKMIRAGVAHYVAHTNADIANPGVSDALAHRLGLTDLRPLDAVQAFPLDKFVTFVPEADADDVAQALCDAGAGRLGDYDNCTFSTTGYGTFRPLVGATPAVGAVGELSRVPEVRLELVAPRRLRDQLIAVLRSQHPYEEPAFDVFEHAVQVSDCGIGRVGELAEAVSLRDFTAYCARLLPATTWGVRAAGDPERVVRTVAVCGGAGGSLIAAAQASGADAYVTSDLRHHIAAEAVTERGADAMALIDAAHWATESPWLDALGARLQAKFGEQGAGLKVAVSTQVTDPWTLHFPSRG
jgi:dinuclear metal center YbgI/SA1388 family protein